MRAMLVLGIFCVSPVFAQPVFENRRVAVAGDVDPNLPVWETDIAVAEVPGSPSVDRLAIAVHNMPGAGMGYAVARKNASGEWEWQQEGTIPLNGASTAVDPSIAYNPVADDFLVTGYVTVSGNQRFGWARSAPARTPFRDGWSWTTEFSTVDKPWVRAGQMDQNQQEFYAVFSVAGSLTYGRTLDGGSTWKFGAITDPAPVTNSFVYHATSPLANDRVYAVSCDSDDKLELFEGFDNQSPDPNDPNTWTVTWSEAKNASNQTIQISLNASAVWNESNERYLALPLGVLQAPIRMWAIPSVHAADPNIVFVTYHDAADANPTTPMNCGEEVRINVSLAKFKRGQDGKWTTLFSRQLVNDNIQTHVADNFFPNITVFPRPGSTPDPNESRVVIAFYSDRNYEDQVDTAWVDPNDPNVAFCPNTDAKFDVFVAYSDNGGSNFDQFADQELIAQAPESAVDYSVGIPGLQLRDYLGITSRRKSDGYEIWVSFTGTWNVDTADHKSVIYAARGFIEDP